MDPKETAGSELPAQQHTVTSSSEEARTDSAADTVEEPKGPPQLDTEREIEIAGHLYSELEQMDLPRFVKRNANTLTFPQKLMLLLSHTEKIGSKSGQRPEGTAIGWTEDGLSIAIRDKEKLVKDLMPSFFAQAKFSSFTRKLYRWGFRQVIADGEDRQQGQVIVFSHQFFQRSNKSLMQRMRSITAARRRRESGAKDAERKSQEPGDQSVARLPSSVDQQMSHLFQRRVAASATAPVNVSSLSQTLVASGGLDSYAAMADRGLAVLSGLSVPAAGYLAAQDTLQGASLRERLALQQLQLLHSQNQMAQYPLSVSTHAHASDSSQLLELLRRQAILDASRNASLTHGLLGSPVGSSNQPSQLEQLLLTRGRDANVLALLQATAGSQGNEHQSSPNYLLPPRPPT